MAGDSRPFDPFCDGDGNIAAGRDASSHVHRRRHLRNPAIHLYRNRLFHRGNTVFSDEGPFFKNLGLSSGRGQFLYRGRGGQLGAVVLLLGHTGFLAGDQRSGETNLHNTSSWLDQKPRLLLFIGMVVGGLIIPALRRWKPVVLPARFSAIYPENHMAITALGVLVPYLLQEVAEHGFNAHIFLRVSEVQEMYMYYFILLYVCDLRKLKNRQESL